MFDTPSFKSAFKKIRQEKSNFITVTNREWYALLKDEIRNSIAIEGIFANRKELLDVLERNKRTDNEKMAAILGYYESASALYDYANNLYKEGEFQLRLADIRQIHTLLTRYESQIGSYPHPAGEFRRANVEVAQSSFTPLAAGSLEIAMPVYVKWVNKNIAAANGDILDAIAASHVLFETIHPFPDGNGRVGRILLNYLLIGCGMVNIAIKGVKKEDRERYYAALETADDAYNRLLRNVEKGELLTFAMLDDATAQSNLPLMTRIIRERLKDALLHLQQKSSAHREDDLLPLRAAARYSGYSQDYLRNLINLGKLPAVKRGKLWHVTSKDIDAYMQKTEN